MWPALLKMVIGLYLISAGMSYEGTRWQIVLGLITVLGWIITGIGVFELINAIG